MEDSSIAGCHLLCNPNEQLSSIYTPEPDIEKSGFENFLLDLYASAFESQTETNDQSCKEASSYLEVKAEGNRLEEKGEHSRLSLFVPFCHDMKPDLEYIRLELERSAPDQEAITKIINDRYKWIMEYSARRKEKEQKDKEDSMKLTPLLHSVDVENPVKTTQLSNASVEDVKKTIPLLQNLYITPGSFKMDLSEEFSDNQQEMFYWDGGLNRFIQLNDFETNKKGGILSAYMLKTVAEQHECRVGNIPRDVMNEQKDTETSMTLTQISQMLGDSIYEETTRTFCDDHDFIRFFLENNFDRRH